jgi:dihydrolipoamide dehydrogenase
MEKLFDVAIIGAGPGGYVAAIRCGELGLSTVCIDDWKDEQGQPRLGGTCLNVGCIPSKALLESSEHYERAARHLGEHGIQVGGVSLDIPAMMARKEKIVQTLNQGIGQLFKKNKVTRLQGRARFAAANGGWTLEVEQDGKLEPVSARHVIVATGSRPAELPFLPFDGERVVDNVGALAFDAVPKRLGVIGAGVVALELGSVWRRLGSQVTVIEPHSFLHHADEQLAREALRQFKAQGLDIRVDTAVTGAKATKKQVTLKLQDASGGQDVAFDRVLVAIGRRPNSEGLGLEKAGLQVDERGFIQVDELCRTNLPNVWAVGDVVRGPMLAHKASNEGIMVAERIAGQAGRVNYATIPNVIYTHPEIAWVGETEQALKAAGREYRKASYPFAANGRALAAAEGAGFVKLLADARTDRLLGVHIIGPKASELIAEAVVAMEFSASSEDLARIVHAHPTLSEALRDAAMMLLSR